MGTSTNSSKPWASDLSLNRPPNPGPRDFPPFLPTLPLYQHEVQAVVDSVPQMLAEGDPLDALRLWFLRLAECPAQARPRRSAAQRGRRERCQ
jgi:hypothetical protein